MYVTLFSFFLFKLLLWGSGLFCIIGTQNVALCINMLQEDCRGFYKLVQNTSVHKLVLGDTKIALMIFLPKKVVLKFNWVALDF